MVDKATLDELRQAYKDADFQCYLAHNRYREALLESSPIRVGDRVTHRDGLIYQISQLTAPHDDIRYYGRRVKKEGTLGLRQIEVWHSGGLKKVQE